MPGTLYLVATPIGNLRDITLRAIDVLRDVDLIACEDTRHSRKLLNTHEINGRLISYHDHNETERAQELLNRLAAGESIALITDSGTPGISDPGYRLVKRARDSEIPVVPIPGAAAFVSGVVVSGLPTDSIFFGGFLPSRTGDRRKRLEEIADIPATLVFYEAPHRLQRTLADCISVLGDRYAAVCRELTKLNEELANGKLSELLDRYSENVRGEIVLVIARKEASDLPSGESADLAARVSELIEGGTDRRTALKTAAKEFGVPRAEAYRLVESQKK